MSGIRNPNTDDWTPVRVATLIDLKRKGRSATQIAKALGGTTRSAVIAKLNRLGLCEPRKDCRDLSSNSTNQGVKTKVLALDYSPAELLKPRRFSWEGDSA